ncbi:MAG: class I SAM-dependent methyltransferase [bacterium]|nr:class I SAM-dependent methyltransferase [bacterium]
MISQFLDGLVFKIQQKRIRKYLNEQKLTSASVLDLGCGYGWYSQLFDGHYTGIDNDADRLAVARKKYADKNFLEMSADTLAFPGQSFDLVVSFLVLHHLTSDQLEKAIKEVKRVLRPGGRFLVLDLVVPDRLSALVRPLMWLDNAERRKSSQLADLFQKSGFQITEQSEKSRGIFSTAFFATIKS